MQKRKNWKWLGDSAMRFGCMNLIEADGPAVDKQQAINLFHLTIVISIRNWQSVMSTPMKFDFSFSFYLSNSIDYRNGHY
jgi:hypothetical protein